MIQEKSGVAESTGPWRRQEVIDSVPLFFCFVCFVFVEILVDAILKAEIQSLL